MRAARRSQAPSPRLLTIYYKHKPGGLCKRLYAMLESMLDRGWEIHYVAVERYPVAHERLIPHIIRLPFRRHEGAGFWLVFLIASAFVSGWIAFRLRLSLIVAFHPAYAACAWPARFPGRVPLALFARSDARALNRILGRTSWLRALDRVTEWAGFRAADRFVFVSEVLMKDLGRRHGLPADRCTVLTNEVALPPAGAAERREARRRLETDLAIRPGDFVIATAGTLNRGKNIPLLIGAFRKMGHEPRVLLVFGDGVDLAALASSTLEEREGTVRVVWAGWRSDVVEFLAGADLFVLPTLFEGMSNALLEAIGLGIPCLASDIPANREVLGSGQALFSLDGVEDLGRSMDRIAEDESFRLGLARAEAERASALRFQWKERVADLLESLAR